jgi:hypothetical protein
MKDRHDKAGGDQKDQKVLEPGPVFHVGDSPFTPRSIAWEWSEIAAQAGPLPSGPRGRAEARALHQAKRSA